MLAAAKREAEERRAVEWGGAFTAESPPASFDLRTLWQWRNTAPGDEQTVFPGGRAALSQTHLHEASALRFAAWFEQVPAQRGAVQPLGRTLVDTTDRHRRILAVVEVPEGLSLSLQRRDGDETGPLGETLRADGRRETPAGGGRPSRRTPRRRPPARPAGSRPRCGPSARPGTPARPRGDSGTPTSVGSTCPAWGCPADAPAPGGGRARGTPLA